MKKILMIASFPPPITGQSVASEAVLECLQESLDVSVVNLSKPGLKAGIDSLSRLTQVLNIIYQVVRQVRQVDVVYFTISQSFFGLLKDLVMLGLCYKSLPKFVIHSHGFGIRYLVLDKHKAMNFIFKAFALRIKKLIVLGPTHRKIMKHLVPEDKLEVVYNFGDPGLVLEKELISEKFCNLENDTLEILYLSNLLPGKGYLELINAYIHLRKKRNLNIKLTIAGGFQSEVDKQSFLGLISEEPSITYVGIADFKTKKALFAKSHVFCLPTYYPFEGQPISILEAYASGCVVVSTEHAGIPDIFTERNGFVVEKASVSSLVKILEEILEKRTEIVKTAEHNHSEFLKRFSKQSFGDQIKAVIM